MDNLKTILMGIKIMFPGSKQQNPALGNLKKKKKERVRRLSENSPNLLNPRLGKMSREAGYQAKPGQLNAEMDQAGQGDGLLIILPLVPLSLDCDMCHSLLTPLFLCPE